MQQCPSCDSATTYLSVATRRIHVWSFGLAPRRRVEVCDRRAPASGADREGRCRGAADVATSAFFRATQFVSPAAVSAGRHASARSSPAISAVEGAETESYAG